MRALLVVVVLLLASPAWAITITPTGTTSDVTFTEPTTNTDGSALTDLDHCNVYAKPTTGNEIKFPNVAATAATGGGSVKTTITVGAGSNYSVNASCTDKVGNESPRSSSVVLDALAPAAPR